MAPVIAFVTVTINPEMVDRFLQVMKEDSIGSLGRENGGCLRFDVLADPKTPNKFMLYEMYKDEAAMKFHKEQPHYLMWAAFKKDGGVLSQEVISGVAVYGAGM